MQRLRFGFKGGGGTTEASQLYHVEYKEQQADSPV